MPSDNSRFRLLVKTAPGPAAVRLSLNGQRFNFTMTPLQAAQRRGVARAIGWHVLTPSPSPGHAEDWGVTNPWEMCHELVRGGLGVAGGPQVEFAEPDLQQQWLVGRPGAIVTKLGLNGPTPDPQPIRRSLKMTSGIRMTNMRNGRSQTSATRATAIECGSRTSTPDMTRITPHAPFTLRATCRRISLTPIAPMTPATTVQAFSTTSAMEPARSVS